MLLGLALGVLRHLREEDVERVGFRLVEQFIDAEEEDAQEALGLLVALWALASEAEGRRDFLVDFVRAAPDTAKRKTAHAVAYNTVGQRADVNERARRIARLLLDEDDAVLRAGMLDGFPFREDVDCSGVGDLVMATVSDGEEEVLKEAVEILSWRVSPPKGELVAPLVEGLLEAPGAMGYIFERLAQFAADIPGLYECIRDSGRQDIALRFLDSAAYHCVEAAREPIEATDLPPDDAAPGGDRS